MTRGTEQKSNLLSYLLVRHCVAVLGQREREIYMEVEREREREREREIDRQ